MATKPVSAFSWATTALYTAGPAIGLVTKVAPIGTEGFVPGAETRPETLNFALNNVGDEWLTGWLLLGSSAAGLDAHLMETDSSGFHNIARMNIGGTAAAAVAFTCNENSGATGTAGEFINAAGGFGITATATAALAAIRGTCTGGAAGIEGQNVGGGGPGGNFTGNGGGAGVTGTGGATGNGATFTSGATSGHGVQGTCIAANFSGVRGVGSATNTGTAGVLGVTAIAAGNAVLGLHATAGANPVLVAESAVRGDALDGTGVAGTSSNGYGVWAGSDPTTPARAAFHLDPQDTDPSVALEGDVYHNSGQTQLKGRINSRWQGVWATEKGFTYGAASTLTQTSSLTTVFQGIISVFLAAPYDPKEINGLVTIKVSFEMGSSVAGSNFEWQLEDVTAGAVFPIPAQIETAHIASAVNADERYVTSQVQYAIPATGPREFELQVRATVGGTTFRIRRIAMEVKGNF